MPEERYEPTENELLRCSRCRIGEVEGTAMSGYTFTGMYRTRQGVIICYLCKLESGDETEELVQSERGRTVWNESMNW